MFSRLRMALAVALAVLPGGIVFLVGWALGRAYAARWKEAAMDRPGAGAVVRAATSVSFRDVLREARVVSGMPAAAAGGR